MKKPAVARTSVPSQRCDQSPPIRSRPPIGGPITTPKLEAIANRRVRVDAAFRRDQVGDHRLVGGAAERAERRHQHQQDEPRPEPVADREEPERNERLEPPAAQDQRPPADPVRPVAARIPGQPGADGAPEVGERQRPLRRVEVRIAQIPM